jgi:hypothetical protein
MGWADHLIVALDVAGFYFLDQAKDYTPEADLAAFLDAGDPPIYIGFVFLLPFILSAI